MGFDDSDIDKLEKIHPRRKNCTSSKLYKQADRLSFEKFMRDSISYAVANRFNTIYPMDMENLKNNFSRINTISLEQIGLVISRVSEDIIDSTIEKSKEIDRARLLTERDVADYNRDIENIDEDRGGK